MLYAIIAEDRAGTLDKRLAARPAHVARLQALQAEGRLILADGKEVEADVIVPAMGLPSASSTVTAPDSPKSSSTPGSVV